jgi:O-antigen ligase
LLPTQLGKHFWPDFTLVSGIRIDYLSPIIHVTDLLLILLLLSFLLRQIRFFKISNIKSQKSIPHLKFQKLIYIFAFVFLFLVCNIIFSARPLLSVYGFVKLCECIFLSYYLTKTIHSLFKLQQIALLFAVSAILESTLAILQYLNQGSLNGIFYFLGERTFTGMTPGIANASINGALILRPYATFPHPNVLAGYLLVSMVLVWSFLLRAQNYWRKIIAGVSLVISSTALLITYSRVAIFLWVLLIIILLIQMGFRTRKTLKIRVLFVAIAGVILVVISFFPLTQEIFYRFINTSLADESVVERTELLNASWTMIQQHFFIGVGLLNFIPNLAPLQKPSPLDLYLQPVHNIFVLVAAETGVMGLVLFVWLLVVSLIRIKNYEARIRRTFFVLFTVILVTGMADHYWLTLQQGQLLFATVIGLSWSKLQKTT